LTLATSVVDLLKSFTGWDCQDNKEAATLTAT